MFFIRAHGDGQTSTQPTHLVAPLRLSPRPGFSRNLFELRLGCHISCEGFSGIKSLQHIWQKCVKLEGDYCKIKNCNISVNAIGSLLINHFSYTYKFECVYADIWFYWFIIDGNWLHSFFFLRKLKFVVVTVFICGFDSSENTVYQMCFGLLVKSLLVL